MRSLLPRAIIVAGTLAAIVCGASPAAAGSAKADEPLKVLTEPYPPYSFEQGGKIRGAAADQIHAIMKGGSVAYSMQILPWARAYAMALRDTNTCIYSTTHTADRDSLFKWVEPIGGGGTVLIRKAGSPIAPKNLEEAKSYLVGVQRGDYGAAYLARKGFKKLDFASDISLTLKKLASGRIDLAVTSESAYQAGIAKGEPLEIALALPRAIYALACSRDVPDETIDRLQKALDRMIEDGTQDKLYIQYGMPAQNLRDYTKKTD